MTGRHGSSLEVGRWGILFYTGHFWELGRCTFARRSMLDRLKEKWGVNGWQLLLILCTFAIGGSLSGYLARQVMGLLEVPSGWYYAPLYVLVVTLLWPLCVLAVSILFGQYSFFTKYLRKLGKRIGIVRSE